MLNIFSYGAALFILLATTSVNAALSESEKILSGFQRVPNVESLPDEIEIPAVWAEALRELSRKSLGTNAAGIEYGVCLNVVAKGIGGEKRQHMEAYRQLLKEKANISSDEFTRKERELRLLIASNGNDQDEGLIWSAGKTQTGKDSTIALHHSGIVCDGEIVSDAHTHPELSTETNFSLPDLAYFIRQNRVSHFVVNSSFAVCSFIRTGATRAISEYFFRDISTEIKPYTWSKDDSYRQRLTWYTQTIGVGLYCGDLSRKMKRIIPQEQSSPKVPPGFYILSAKAHLSFLERLEDTPTRVASNFLPEIDNSFSKYLLETLPQKTHYINFHDGKLGETPSPEEIFRYALSFYHPKNKRPLRNIGDIICSATSKVCMSADDLWKGKPKKHFAIYSYITQNSYFIQGNESTGFYRFSEEPQNKTSYTGSCKFFDNYCLPDGSGILKTSDFEYHGEFQSGKMNGNGKIIKPLQNEIYQVKMMDGQIKESKRVQ